jgi:hypothetical protein
MNKSVAVVGGGIFGCVAALELAQGGYAVTLFERAPDLMAAASAINQYRLHRGYHYPRSSETILSCLGATPLFEEAFREAIIEHHAHYYGIAKEGSKLSGVEYLKVLDAHNLPYTVETPDHINPDALDLCIKAEENLYDPNILRELFRARLRDAGVDVRINTEVDADNLEDFDFVVLAAYAHLNSAMKHRTDAHREYQFEVCEKIVIEMPKGQEGVSTVIMDGPFMSYDPLGTTGYAVMGHVDHAIHHRSFGHHPEVPEAIAPLLNRGIIKNPQLTNAPQFFSEGARFMPALKDAVHVGSMYTIRTVLPNVDHTDERPTLVRKIDGRTFTLYSGKIGTSVQAARVLLELIKTAG